MHDEDGSVPTGRWVLEGHELESHAVQVELFAARELSNRLRLKDACHVNLGHGLPLGAVHTPPTRGQDLLASRLRGAFVGAPAFSVQTRLDQLQHRFSRKVKDLRKDGPGEQQPQSFVHKGATRLAPTSKGLVVH
jgi:hypothetical protein